MFEIEPADEHLFLGRELAEQLQDEFARGLGRVGRCLRAVGARKRNILTQFIMEAIVICQVGGVLGVLFGVAGGNVAAYFLKVTPVIPLDWVALGLIICSLVGIIFGTYPAIKAANLDPIDSLRYE